MSVESLYRDIANLNLLIGQIAGDYAEINAKIERLNNAKQAVIYRMQDDQSYQNWLSHYDAGGNWQGHRREEYERRKREIANVLLKHYIDGGVQQIVDTISREIQNLESQKLDIIGRINQANEEISKKRNEICKFESQGE